eukprot:g4807.t1
MEKMVFDYYAEQIQKIWRAHFSRRYKHDFHARKEYLQKVLSQGASLKAKLDGYAAEQAIADRKRQAEKYEAEFRKVTSNLHHLLSTQRTPGIYNNPYMQDDLPSINGITVEEHLRSAIKDYLADDSRKKKKYVKPKKNPTSVSAGSSY